MKVKEIDYKKVKEAEKIIGKGLEEVEKSDVEEYYNEFYAINRKHFKNMNKFEIAQMVLETKDEVERKRKMVKANLKNIKRLANKLKEENERENLVKTLRELYIKVQEGNINPKVKCKIKGKRKEITCKDIKKSLEKRNLEVNRPDLNL